MKYFLILFSVFTFGQASNQMVTFTAAQSLGFSLNSGQSSVTSNQCMTKNDALTKYALSASAMSAYANNQLVPRSVWVSGTFSLLYTGGFSTSGQACSNAQYLRLYSTVASPGVGDVLYLDAALTTPAGGGNLWYANTDCWALQINNSGVVIARVDCIC